jgi:hypothetical protein
MRGSSTLPLAFGNTTTSALSGAAPGLPAKSSAFAPCRIFALRGVSMRLSTMTRNGWRGVSNSRTVSCGSSAFTVPMPVRMAQARARQR